MRAPADRRSSLAGDNLQEVLDSASNAASKGAAQWSTPPLLAARLATFFGQRLPVICDLTCGPGSLLYGCSGLDTDYLLGLDIDARSLRKPKESVGITRIVAPLLDAYPLLVEVDFRAELFVLNPPWDLHWPQAPLLRTDAAAGASDHNALVRWRDPRLGPGEIDSAIATWLIALDRSEDDAEGFTLLHGPTFHRLVRGPGAPWSALMAHVVAVLEFDHWDNPAHRVVCAWWRKDKRSPGAMVPILKAATGCPVDQLPIPTRTDAGCRPVWRYRDRGVEEWEAVRSEIVARAQVKPRWNLWLQPDGTIGTYLSLFETRSVRIPKEEAKTLHDLTGRTPMDLVLRRQEREALRRTVQGGLWKSTPELQAHVDAALAQYEVGRAPIIPLPPVQRLGFLDEHDTLACVRDLPGIYAAGTRYRLESSTVRVRRRGARVNSEGEEEPVEYTGSELVLSLHSEAGKHHYVDPRLLRQEVTFLDFPETDRLRSLRELLEHFEIPEVPDIATLNPHNAKVADENVRLLEGALRHRCVIGAI